MTTVGDYSKRQTAVEETVKRLNAECAADGLPADYRARHTAGGVPYVGLAGIRKRERLGTPKRDGGGTKRERL